MMSDIDEDDIEQFADEEEQPYSDTGSEEVETHWIQSIYRALFDRGVKPGDISVNYECPEGAVSLALPESKLGLSFDEDDKLDGLREEGWTIFAIPVREAETFHSVFTRLQSLLVERDRQKTFDTIKSTSKPEQRLIDALLAKNVPIPDRNYKIMREDGKRELTTPDMVWEDIQLAFFVDGVWWHNAKDNTKVIKDLQTNEGKDFVIRKDRSRMERDTSNRSQLVTMGWTVLSCTDTQLENDKDIQKQVTIIMKMIRELREQKRILERARKQSKGTQNAPSDSEDIDDLLSAFD